MLIGFILLLFDLCFSLLSQFRSLSPNQLELQVDSDIPFSLPPSSEYIADQNRSLQISN